MPTFSRQDLDQTHFHLTIAIPQEEIKPKVDSEFKRFRQRANIKGFRQGQAPAHYVKSLFGSSVFYDTFTKMVSEHLYGYLRDQNLMALGQPLPIDNQKKYNFNIDRPEAEYELTYEIGHVPHFEIVGLDKSHSYELLEVNDLDQLAHSDLENARKQAGKQINAEDSIQEKDILRVKSVELENGAPKEGGWETTISVFVENIPDANLKQQLLQLKKGDTIRFDVTQLEEERETAFLRRYILNIPQDDDRPVGNEFEGVIEEVSRMAPADLNEEFLQGYFGENVHTEGEAIEEIKKGIAQYYRSRAEALVMREIQDRLIELNQFPLPEAFLKRYLVIDGTFPPGTAEERYPAFAESLRWSILRQRLVDQFEVVVTDDEIKREFASTLLQYFRAEIPGDLLNNYVKRMMQNKKEVERVENTIEYEKIFKAAIELVTLVPKPVPSETFHAAFDAARKQVAEQNEAAE